MAGNLFFLRGWTITLIGALLALFSKNNSPYYVFYFLIVIVLPYFAPLCYAKHQIYANVK
ncbi:hypothetical protein COV58_01725 [Candidatus Roizmanbacteria bacterium CG11_big_fil_rev_8_21_14_0_20_36_8]|uniref:Uncharacterized protein n=1 Tax=Candidatus Roizmanbacteria bacterium CG11_big_fil_rev_8_21_14_0_20_36_8 TaxID=1974856 RepID=A0A2M6IUZ7_9BACT|nr:MAG: hypothetical protein COV58_01725 [Candidatus Roizmanbacteria bacterium CG11_big_fil_rev_8_21_14_0_20_36_8]